MRYQTRIILFCLFRRYRFRTSNKPDLNACFDLILAAGADVNKTDKNGATALIKAAGCGSTWCVNALIAAGACVNKFDREGFSPLMSATCANHSEIVECLIKAGANVNVVSRNRCRKPKRADRRLQNDVGRTQVNRAISSKYPLIAAAFPYRQESGKIIDTLISAGADVNVVDRNGKTTLLLICYDYSPKMLHTVRSLIAAGADVNRSDNSGGTPLSCVYDVDCARELLLAGAQINRTTRSALPNINTFDYTRRAFNHLIRKPSAAKELRKLLFASGESSLIYIPDSLFSELKLNLMHLCRKAIRCSIVYRPPCFNLAPAHLFQLSCCCEWDPPLT